MPTSFVRSMLWLGLLALILAVAMLWRSVESTDRFPSSPTPITSGKPIGNSTLSHGGPGPAGSNDPQNAVSQR